MAKAKRGRRRQDGDRFPSGKLRQAWDYGCDGVQRRREEYALKVRVGNVVKIDASQTFDAIGRAWSAGLLEADGKDAAAMRDAGRDTAALYWRAYGLGTQDSLSRFVEGMGSGAGSSERERTLEGALNRRLDAINKLGRSARSAFDALCIDFNPDFGPSWLDTLIWHKRRHHDLPQREKAILDAALKGLASIV